MGLREPPPSTTSKEVSTISPPVEVTYVSIREAAELLGVSRQRTQELIRQGKLPAQRLAGGKIWLIRESDVLARLQQMSHAK